MRVLGLLEREVRRKKDRGKHDDREDGDLFGGREREKYEGRKGKDGQTRRWEVIPPLTVFFLPFLEFQGFLPLAIRPQRLLCFFLIWGDTDLFLGNRKSLPNQELKLQFAWTKASAKSSKSMR